MLWNMSQSAEAISPISTELKAQETFWSRRVIECGGKRGRRGGYTKGHGAYGRDGRWLRVLVEDIEGGLREGVPDARSARRCPEGRNRRCVCVSASVYIRATEMAKKRERYDGVRKAGRGHGRGHVTRAARSGEHKCTYAQVCVTWRARGAQIGA